MFRRNLDFGKEKVARLAIRRLAGEAAARHNHRCAESRTVPQPYTSYPDSETETGRNVDDIFLPSGRLRPDILDEGTARVLREALAHTRSTNWDSVRTPHLFMGLLAAPDTGVFKWALKLGADLPGLLDQFRELFHQPNAEPVPPLLLNREFLSDNVIRLLRDAHGRAGDSGRASMTPMDLLITLFTTPNSIVAECFERIGVTAAKLTELAMLAERDAPAK
jgi:Clp amino terminal domain, pathogenicity island component